MVQRILVPLDGTTFSEQALSVAVSIAKRSSAAVFLATVEVPTPIAFPDVNFIEPLSAAEHSYLTAIAERLREEGVAEVSVDVLTGHAPEALESHRAEVGADLTVMATHGRGPAARAWLGGVADQFVRSTTAPVLMIRPKDDDEPDLSSLPSFDRVLVTLDGSALSESALQPAQSMARLFDSAMTLVRLVEYPNRPESVYLPDAIEGVEGRLEESRMAAHEELERIAAQLDAGSIGRVSRVVTHAAEGILRVADEQDADLVVMASHGRGGLGRMLLGSVADKVLRGSERPVLIVRAES